MRNVGPKRCHPRAQFLVGFLTLLAVFLTRRLSPWSHNITPSYIMWLYARQPILKMESTRSVPDLPLHQGHKWHMFLSPTVSDEHSNRGPAQFRMPAAHLCLSRTPSAWGSGQDQCATIKRQLERLMPGVAIFLDVTAARNQTFPSACSLARPRPCWPSATITSS